MKELKNKVDSIRRTLKNQNITVSSAEIENKILELCPNFPDDWCSDIRTEIIKALTKGIQSIELAPVEVVNNLQIYDDATDESSVNSIDTDVNSIDNDELADTQELPEVSAIAPQETSQLTVSSADKQALVATQSMALGFELSEQETTAIADTVDDVFSDYSSFLNGVTAAIKQYVDHRFDDIETTLDNNTYAVREHIADRATRLNQKVENFSTNIKADIGGIRQQIKSSQASILARFALPSKAG